MSSEMRGFAMRPAPAPRVAVPMSQFLTFAVGEEEYGIDILNVQEIKGYGAVTPVPNVPEDVKGVMNLRGVIIPVFDLRVRFGLSRAEYTRFNAIIVVTVGPRIMGVVVDTVSDVLTLPTAEVQPPPDFGDKSQACPVCGLARTADKVVMILDVDRLLGGAVTALESVLG